MCKYTCEDSTPNEESLQRENKFKETLIAINN